ncbi:MAG: SurA N-terminal domain-containing protein [Limnobacter sp.]|nr:SurA N-terminal domain-containing protein [Limnobacter sp.]
MFDFIRNHQKLMQFLLLIFIAPAFVLMGVEGYSTSTQADAYAVVGTHSITQEEFDESKRQRIDQARQESQGNFDPLVFDRPEVNNQLLQSMVTEYLLQQAVIKGNLTASDKALQDNIMKTALFQVDGKFDLELYKRELTARGLSATQHEANLRFGLARAQVLDPLLQGAFMTKPVSAMIDDAQLAGRVVQTKRLDVGAYAAKVQVGDDEITAFYDKNQARFANPAQADVEYLALSPAAIKSQITVSDDDVSSYYEQNKARFSEPEQRRVRHILLMPEDAKSEPDLKAHAEKVLAEVQKAPKQFAELAAKYSKDTVSAQQGGDVGFFGKGMMVPEFEQAAYGLKKGELSGLVKTQFGYHILEVTDIKGGTTKSLAEVKELVVEDIRNQKLTVKYAEAQNTFSEGVFEGGKSFDAVAKSLGLTPQTGKGLTEAGVKDNPLLSDKALLAEVFSTESVTARNNSKAVTVGDTLVSARVVNFVPKATKPLAEVKAEVVAIVRQEKALAEAKKDAEALVAKLNSSKGQDAALLAGFEAEKMVSALSVAGLEGSVGESILSTGVAELPKAIAVSAGNGGVVVAWVTKNVPSAEVKAKAEPQIVQFYEGIASRSYQEALAIAAREALSKRVGVEVKKTF